MIKEEAARRISNYTHLVSKDIGGADTQCAIMAIEEEIKTLSTAYIKLTGLADGDDNDTVMSEKLAHLVAVRDQMRKPK